MENKKQIVFFCATTPYVMIYKIAREFKKRGYETVLATFCRKETWEKEWYRDGFDKMYCSDFQVTSPSLKNLKSMAKRLPALIKFIYQIKKLKPYAVFAVARPNYMTALAMKFFKKYPVIYFPYDITSQQYSNLNPDSRKYLEKYNPDIHEFFFEDSNPNIALKKGVKKYEINAEKYCFEHADGLMHKGAPEELEFLKGKTILGYNILSRITPLKINFHPYCSDDFIVSMNNNKLSKKNGEIHLVYVGGLDANDEAYAFYRALFQKLFAQKIHLHLYIKTQHLSQKEDSENFSSAFETFKNNKYFHLEYSLDPKTLIKEISRYDFGFSPDNPRVGFDANSLFGIGNKTATYLEAGISSIEEPKRRFVPRIMKKYKIWGSFSDAANIDKFSQNIKKTNLLLLNKNIIKARKDFNMTKHFPRLEGFVEEVVSKKNHNNLFK